MIFLCFFLSIFPGGCCSYSPEYYINIRTGIHYFPKGNTTTGTDASNRFKSGLNRIEEKNDEVSVMKEGMTWKTNVHMRKCVYGISCLGLWGI